jgi:Outer membrane lipoprotein
MTDERPASLEAAADLRRMLRDLGHDGPKTERDPAQESAREARMAALIDAEVESLVSARRAWRRVSFGVVAAAALVALTLGVRHARLRPGSLAISPEPVTAANGGRPVQHAEPQPALPATPLAVPSALPRSNVAPSGASAAAPVTSAEPQSTLGEENQLFKEAAEAGRTGDVSGALSRLDKLLVEHPASPLAQTAMVRKFRLLAKAGQADEARREAERYLLAYPTGFAVDEARALKAGHSEPNAP